MTGFCVVAYDLIFGGGRVVRRCETYDEAERLACALHRRVNGSRGIAELGRVVRTLYVPRPASYGAVGVSEGWRGLPVGLESPAVPARLLGVS